MKRPFRPLYAAVASLCLVSALCCLPACDRFGITPEAAAEIKAQQEATQKTLDQAKADALAAKQKAQAEADAAAAAHDAAAQAIADAAAAKAQKTLDAAAAAQKKIDIVNAAIAKALNPDGSVNVEGTVGTASGFLPPPWNIVALIGVPIVVGWIQQRRVKAAKNDAQENKDVAIAIAADAKSIVKGIGAVAATDPAFAAKLVKHKATLMENYTDGAVQIVDNAKPASADRLTPEAMATAATPAQ